MENFKIRVVENVGEDSIETFGEVGNELEVINGKLIDLDDDSWSGCGTGFEDIDDVNDWFSDLGDYGTVFELVESGDSNE